MKNVLFATTAASALLIGGIASAQGIALFGDARLGLGYNINNDGGVNLEFDDQGNLEVTDDLIAVSRVRFGVNMTGETDSGITFGATIRADNAVGGQGQTTGQRAGSVFVSGSWGTLTFGDTNGADEQWVGDVPGDYSVTGLGELDETRFVSNGGSFGADSGSTFANNPFARPTIRYDFDIMGFGVSASSNRDLTDIAVGTGYSADFGGGSWSLGVGYNSFEEFTQTGDIGGVEVCGPDGVDQP
jgi:outer membrane protein OmpU